MRTVAICGTGSADDTLRALAEQIGHAVVQRGAVLICGGMGGVMEAACRGGQRARAAGASGLVLGILPADQLDGGNGLCDVVIPTGMGVARNVLVVRSADAVILVGGGAGTLSEAAFAWQLNKPLIAMGDSGGWAERLAGQVIDDRRSDRVLRAGTPEEAVNLALNLPGPG